jgi:serine/threonine protein kinase
MFETQNHGFLVMPYLDGGTLADQIFSQQHFVRNPTHIRRVFFQLALAVNFCHAHGVAHRDIKPQNILCTLNRLHVSLSDFGLATYERHSSSFQCGTRAYMGPGKSIVPNQTIHFVRQSKHSYLTCSNMSQNALEAYLLRCNSTTPLQTTFGP